MAGSMTIKCRYRKASLYTVMSLIRTYSHHNASRVRAATKMSFNRLVQITDTGSVTPDRQKSGRDFFFG
jgi:hypothetical protein